MKKEALSRMGVGWRLILVAALALVLLSITVVPAVGISSAQGANPSRSFSPDDEVLRNETFDVIVTFTAPDNDFNSHPDI